MTRTAKSRTSCTVVLPPLIILACIVVFWALPSMGEAWHHNHHAFPRTAWAGSSSTSRPG